MEQLFNVENLNSFLSSAGYTWSGNAVLTPVRTSHLADPRVVNSDEYLSEKDIDTINSNMQNDIETTIYLSLKKNGEKKVLSDACVMFDSYNFKLLTSVQAVLIDEMVRKNKSNSVLNLSSKWKKFNTRHQEGEYYSQKLAEREVAKLYAEKDRISSDIEKSLGELTKAKNKCKMLESKYRDVCGKIEELTGDPNNNDFER